MIFFFFFFFFFLEGSREGTQADEETSDDQS
jgi:hypothetical protein